jgi:hypothetical protein
MLQPALSIVVRNDGTPADLARTQPTELNFFVSFGSSDTVSPAEFFETNRFSDPTAVLQTWALRASLFSAFSADTPKPLLLRGSDVRLVG